MEHPFIKDLDDKSLDELQTSLSELSKKLTFAYRTQNGALINQLQMAMESYKVAYQKKMDDLVRKQNISMTINVTKK